MNRLYKFNSLEVLQNTGWMYLSVIIPFLFFRYYREPIFFFLDIHCYSPEFNYPFVLVLEIYLQEHLI